MRRRFFVGEAIREGDGLPLAPGESRHALTVLRLREGATIEIASTAGIFGGMIEKVDAGIAWVRVLEPLSAVAIPDITLAFGLAHRKATDDVVRKATELGVKRLLPVACRRGESISQEALARRHHRLLRVARAAAKQSRRDGIPEILGAAAIDAIASLDFRTGILFVPGLANPEPRDVAAGGPFLVVVGPEGGFAKDELDRLSSAGLLLRGLPCPVLRVETAVVAAVTATLLLLGLAEE